MSSRAALRTLILALFLAPYYCQKNCQYLFLEQPSSAVGCNPWGYTHDQGNKLTLRCTITGPWSTTNVPNMVWLKGHRAYLDNATQIYYDQKYSDLTSSEDLGDGLMKAFFTLNVNSVGALDIGCYWCQVQIHSSNCTSILFNSTVFCLREETAYSGTQSCTQLAPNMNQSCAGNFSCSNELSSSSLPPPSSSTLSPVSSRTPETSLTTSTDFTPHPTPAAEQPSIVPSLIAPDDSSQPTNNPTSPSSSPTPPPPPPPSPPPPTPPPSPSFGQPTDPQPSVALRVGLYVGVALCFVLLAVMTGLVAAIIALLHKTSGTPPQSQQGSMSSRRSSRRELESSGSRSIASVSLGSTQPLPISDPQGPTAARPPVPLHQSDSFREARPLPSVRGHYYYVLEGPLNEPTGGHKGPGSHWGPGGQGEADPVIVVNGEIITEGAAAVKSREGVYVKSEDRAVTKPNTKLTRNPH